MEPRIQYAKASDGVNIAYWTLGEGPPLVQMWSIPFGHSQLEWQIPEVRRLYERLARNTTLVGFDSRGTGLSDRSVTEFSLDALVLDLEAVVDRLGLARFALGGAINSGPVAVAYAARHPQRVSHLFLWCSWARGAEALRRSPLFEMLETDWEMYTETAAYLALGWSHGEQAHRFAAFMRESIAQEAAVAFHRALARFEVSSLLPQVTSPTLVLHRRQLRWPELALSRELASSIPNAQLVLLEGESLAPYLGDMEAMVGAMEEVLAEKAPNVEAATLPSGMTAILFADIVDSTALTERLGDATFRAKARDLDGALRALIREHAGTPIEGKLLGDGVLAVFTSARQAIEAALACGRAGDDADLPLHLGLHAGDVIREENNVYGGAVNIASRISGLSAPGEVLVSETVRSLARTSAGVRFEDRGEQALKGVGETVRVWAVVEGEV